MATRLMVSEHGLTHEQPIVLIRFYVTIRLSLLEFSTAVRIISTYGFRSWPSMSILFENRND